MESEIARNLQPEFAPVAVVWSNTLPDDTLCSSIAAFAYARAESTDPRAVLGMLGIDGLGDGPAGVQKVLAPL